MVYFYWNYFLALEQDIINLARYIDFVPENFKTFSSEITKIYLASASEFDVITKEFCLQFDDTGGYEKLGDRYNSLKKHMHLRDETVSLHKYDLDFQPLSKWTSGKAPTWWTKYNKLKHNRNEYYQEANLENCLNSMAALFLACVEYYSHELRILDDGEKVEGFSPKEYLSNILPDTDLFRLSSDYYYGSLLLEG